MNISKKIITALLTVAMIATIILPAYATVKDEADSGSYVGGLTLETVGYVPESYTFTWYGVTHHGLWAMLLKQGTQCRAVGFCGDPGAHATDGGTYESTNILDNNDTYNKQVEKAITWFTNNVNSTYGMNTDGTGCSRSTFSTYGDGLYYIHSFVQLYTWAYQTAPAEFGALTVDKQAEAITNVLCPITQNSSHMTGLGWNDTYKNVYAWINQINAQTSYRQIRCFEQAGDTAKTGQTVLVMYYGAGTYWDTGTLKIVKASDDGNIAGITFHITGPNYDRYFTTNSAGIIRIDNLTVGTYTVTETVPTNYTATTPNPQLITIVSGQTSTANFSNHAYTAKLHVIKTDAESGKTIPAAGATFTLTNAAGTTVGTYTTDENGEFDVGAIHFGTYTLTETKAPGGYKIAAPVTVTVDPTAKTSIDTDGIDVIQINVPDSPIKTALNITKKGTYISSFTTDSDGNVIPVYKTDGEHGSGTTFKVFAGEDIITGDGTKHYSKGDVVATVTTDATGNAVVNDLYIGKYYVRETNAANGYVNDPACVVISSENWKNYASDRGTGTANYNEAADTVTFTDDAELDELKNTEGAAVAQLLGVNNLQDLTDEELQQIIDQGGYLVTPTTAGIHAYNIIAHHNIQATLENTNTAYSDAGITYINTQQIGVIQFEKTLEQDKVYGAQHDDEYKAVTYGLYLAKDVTSENGSKLKAGTLMQTAALAENGTVTFKTAFMDLTDNNMFLRSALPYGTYYIQELTTGKDYVLDTEKYYFSYDANGNVTFRELYATSGKTLLNKLKRGTVTGTKTSQDGKPLAGSVIGIFSSDTTEYTADTAIATATTTDTGNYTFTDVPTGTYVIREISAPSGYQLNTKNYTVTVKDNGDVEQIDIEDEAVPAPKTGDNTKIVIYIVFLVIAVSGLVFAVIRKRKQQ